MQMLVMNRVQDYETWRKEFDNEDARAKKFGLTVDRVWRDVDDPQVVYFTLNVESRERAEAFTSDPESAKVGERAGVIDGWIRYIDAV